VVTLARRIRECRYTKGWGPDELAGRAEISRTALYQIESGKTEIPRAGTLRRIAEALGVSMEVLLDDVDLTDPQPRPRVVALGDDDAQIMPIFTDDLTREGVELELERASEDITFERDSTSPFHPAHRSLRKSEIAAMFLTLLNSPFGEPLARIVEESYALLPVEYRERQASCSSS
jgi:transcriptional regulator with XRE-family HTH domain